ncbi:amino acid ABC transporter permease, partial [Turicibacter sanguinis]|nr:amino acid ABC transporter permease [Turicibacter sanguinis]
MSFEFLVDYYPMLLKGTGVTIALALITVFFG